MGAGVVWIFFQHLVNQRLRFGEVFCLQGEDGVFVEHSGVSGSQLFGCGQVALGGFEIPFEPHETPEEVVGFEIAGVLLQLFLECHNGLVRISQTGVCFSQVGVETLDLRLHFGCLEQFVQGLPVSARTQKGLPQNGVSLCSTGLL